MFTGFYLPIPDVDAFLDRLGLKRPKHPDVEYLNQLIFQYQCEIIFENLDVYKYHKVPSLNIPDLYEKFVIQKRGGYCFEMNGILEALLQELGYDCFSVQARIVHAGDPHPRSLHRAILVNIDGIQYFCDVGYGGPSPAGAVPLTKDGAFVYGNETFRAVRLDDWWWSMHRITPKGESVTLDFSVMPQTRQDFQPFNLSCATPGVAVFSEKYFLNRRTPDGNVSLTGDKFVIVKNGERTEKTVTDPAEIHAIAREYFGIDWPAELDD